MRAVVGLGNPGEEYARTRHNVGFWIVEELARRWGADFSRERRGSRVARARFGGEPVALIEPLMFMNCSGDALARLDADLRPSAAEMVVVHDDLDLACGRINVKKGGGTGGHRGLASLVSWCGADFARTRVGIGRPPLGQEVATFVLRPFRSEERSIIDRATMRAADAVEEILTSGVTRAMNTFNSKPADAGNGESPEERR
jgi:PTH1 family peptidyl-tRNA hydrolase